MASKKYSIDVSKVLKGITDFDDAFDKALMVFAQSGAQKMEQYAKKNRKWTDRTGRARQSLNSSAFRIDNGYRIQIAHGVYYGVYLEYAHERKYAILERTVTKVGMEQIMPAFHNFLNAIEKKVGK